MGKGRIAPLVHEGLRLAARWLFTVFHDIRVHGAEHVPEGGAAIIAANHPTYLDPAFLMVGLGRPVRFMAWEKPFRLPLLGVMMRAYGAIPVNMKKPGRASFEAAVKVLRGGELFGIFPEGGRTKTAEPMNPVKSGVARLALITGAPIVPATIVGGRRVWRRGELFPKPGPITVYFHPPLRVEAGERARWRRDRTLERQVIDGVLARIHKKLVPSLRRDKRVDRILAAAPQPPTLWVEGLPFIFLAAAWLLLPAEAWPRLGAPNVPWLAGSAALLGLELAVEWRGKGLKWVRQVLPWVTLAAFTWSSFGSPNKWNLPLESAFLIALGWFTFFRFPAYRKVRTPLLLAGYGAWLAEVVTRSRL
ncbi:MAG: 1-acyl-sn-glycerol-3-phosphate acyltransferase [Elusimicrobia bacterium]|nr:1-acyl-sn-glycerol-3-phosphate acyltransferase [Elusimicrobiota bacterium]